MPKADICGICLNQFTKPKVTPCGHTFCELCLKDYVNTAAHYDQFACPLCRMRVPLSKDGIAIFPYLRENAEDLNGRPSTCTSHGQKMVLYCRSCCESLCHQCFTFNHQGHKLEDLESVITKKRTELEQIKNTVHELIIENNENKDEVIQMISTQSESLKRENRKIDDRIEMLGQILQDAGNELKSGLQAKINEDLLGLNLSLNELEDFGSHLKDLAQETTRVNGSNDGDVLETTPLFRQQLEAFKTYNYQKPVAKSSCFALGHIDTKELKKQIGKVKTVAPDDDLETDGDPAFAERLRRDNRKHNSPGDLFGTTLLHAMGELLQERRQVPVPHRDGSDGGARRKELVHHPHVVCDGCGSGVYGIRYKCFVCPDYDLCSKCLEKKIHQHHQMRAIPFPT